MVDRGSLMATKLNFDTSKLKTYYDTLWELFQAVEEVYGVEILHTGGIQYGQTEFMSLDIGHPKKRLQIQIYRMESGRYEYNGYVL